MNKFQKLQGLLISVLIFLPLLIAVTVPLLIYHTLVILIARLTRRELKERLTAYDSIFAVDNFYSKPYAANITCIFTEGNVELSKLKNKLISVLSLKNPNGSLKFSRMLQVPEKFLGLFFWKNSHLDFNKLVRKSHDFSLEDDFEEHERELHSLLGEIMTQGFVQNQPLWEVLLFNGYKNGQSVIVIRIHHTLGDGYSFNHLIDNLIQKNSQYFVKSEDHKGALANRVKLLTMAPEMAHTLFTEGLASKRNRYTSRKKSSTGVLSMTKFNLSTLKEIRRVTKTHFATIGMSLMTGALRRYHLETFGDKDLPPWVSIMHSLPKPNHPLIKMVNHWGVGLFKIPFAVQNPLQRLLQAEAVYNKYMDDQYDQLLQIHMPILGWFPLIFLKIFFSANFGTSMGFTSVPAYQGEADFAGHKITHMCKIFGLQWRQSGVATAVYTHNGEVGYTMFANKDIIPDQKSMDKVVKNYLHQELEELALLTGVYKNNKSIQRSSEPFA